MGQLSLWNQKLEFFPLFSIQEALCSPLINLTRCNGKLNSRWKCTQILKRVLRAKDMKTCLQFGIWSANRQRTNQGESQFSLAIDCSSAVSGWLCIEIQKDTSFKFFRIWAHQRSGLSSLIDHTRMVSMDAWFQRTYLTKSFQSISQWRRTRWPLYMAIKQGVCRHVFGTFTPRCFTTRDTWECLHVTHRTTLNL